MKAKKVNVGKCFYPAGIGFPLLVILIGLYFLLKAMGYIQESAIFWPVVIISIGVYWLVQRIYRSSSMK
ncbi:hypothetical protein KY332_01830 [Candidatus Woesearchaeota archaeon]|nr:hypothetical protein [Candidatus Woesearchaeota archaeon]